MPATPWKTPLTRSDAWLFGDSVGILESSGDPDVMDAALNAAAQRIEHYEIAAYGSVKAFAKRLDYGDAARLLDSTLAEEGTAARKLTHLADGRVLLRSISKEAANA